MFDLYGDHGKVCSPAVVYLCLPYMHTVFELSTSSSFSNWLVVVVAVGPLVKPMDSFPLSVLTQLLALVFSGVMTLQQSRFVLFIKFLRTLIGSRVLLFTAILLDSLARDAVRSVSY